MTGKNRTLFVVFVVLLVVNVLFALLGGRTSGVSFDETKFTVADTAGIARVVIGESLELSSANGQWTVNEKYPMDPGLNKLLLTIFQRVRVKKPVDVPVQEPQTVALSGSQPMTFQVWGNATKTKTYFSLQGEEEAYEVHIPGYNEYLGGLFELTANQWRDRLLLNASWRTIQQLELDYAAAKDLKIVFDKDFFQVDGIAPIDSNAVVDYLNQFQFFQGNEWVSSMPAYDSLSRQPPLATLSVETLSEELPVILDIYPALPGDRYQLVKTYDEGLILIDRKKVAKVLQKPEDFSFSE
ncbi:hypothetical protein [Marinoscillum furvescens]|uniref:DUF4340 domain-containing protein n=1 Tax=Marinoscillum furvescens DSM 4134 TaxID=1122208 RepID=A0A3D9LG47_MARFU|nr:hypothetical protein [Marinoscillum furvescens]REE05650.1 hypothetical protein C7460_101167 [Marinoscillum furvescens DSM 4134]